MAICNFENRKDMRVVISLNCLKFDLAFRNGVRNWAIFFNFLDKCIWIGYGKFWLLQRKYLSSGVLLVILTKSLKISHITNRDIFKLNFSRSNDKYHRSAVMQNSQVSTHFWQNDCRRVFCNGASWTLV